jgi:hypothetical protein
MGARSKTHSRCGCGHKIVKVDGKWQHEEPHPDHACSCSEPEPGQIGHFRTEKTKVINAGGIATLGNSMIRVQEQEKETKPWQLMGSQS